MASVRPISVPLFDPARSRRRALGLLVVLLALHIWSVWGYADLWWSDHARWLSEVERYARGDIPYRDFTWPHPPLALWLIGGLARLFGTDLAPVTAVTSAVAVLVLLAYYRVVTLAVAGTALPAVITGLVLASGYATRFGAPLPLGTSTPAGPVGMLFVLSGAALAIMLRDLPSHPRALALGVMAGLAVLTRHEHWIPAAALLVFGLWSLRRATSARALRTSLAAGFAVTVLAGTIATFLQSGGLALLGLIPTGLTQIVLSGFPSWERLTIEAAATCALGLAGVAALWLCLALTDARARWIGGILVCVFLSACAIHMGMTVSMARTLAVRGLPASPTTLEATIYSAVVNSRISPARVALFLLDQRFQQHLFPAILPPILLLVLLVRWRTWTDLRARDLALLLLLLASTLRLRRGLSGTDWYNVLVELPGYALFLHLVAATEAREARRAVSVAIAILLVVGLYTRYTVGRGPLTAHVYPSTTTERGRVHWPAQQGTDYLALAEVLDQLDPGHHRPLFAFGPSGGWNYYFKRPHATPFTRGLVSDADADSAAVLMRASALPPLIVDNRAIVRAMVPPRLTALSWEGTLEADTSNRMRSPAFERLLAGCRMVVGLPGPPVVPVYDCPARAALTPRDSSR